jgi:nicotinate-nucleotide pyrophosphorylase (carboxylating)
MQPLFGLNEQDFIKWSLMEDIGDGDHTSIACIEAEAKGRGVVKAKATGIIAGISLAEKIFKQVDGALQLETYCSEGDKVEAGTVLISISGSLRSILAAERLVLNCMQRMSGIATKTHALAELIKGTKTKILDTRKTTPNFRLYEKSAVQIGGGVNHRFGLYDMILIKDNHVDAAGGIVNAIEKANQYLIKLKKILKIEIETRNMQEVQLACDHGKVHRIMLDNFSIENLKKAVDYIDGRYETEASGSITEENIRAVAETGVDFISVGALTHSYKSLDINLKVERL